MCQRPCSCTGGRHRPSRKAQRAETSKQHRADVAVAESKAIEGWKTVETAKKIAAKVWGGHPAPDSQWTYKKLYAELRRQRDVFSDAYEHALQLVDYLRPIKCCVNVIPYNPRRESPWPAPSEESVRRFIDWLNGAGQFTKRRVTKGRDFSYQGAVDGLRINDRLFDFEEKGVSEKGAK